MIGGLSAGPPAQWRIGLLASVALLVVGVALVFVHAGSSDALPVGLTAKEFSFDPKDVVAGTGEVALLVKNQGALEHNLVLVGPGGKPVTLIPIIEPGQMVRVTVVLRAGVYPLYCGLPGHKDAGMTATLRVNS